MFGSHCFQSRLNGRRGSCLGAAVNAVTPVVEVGAQMRAPSLERGIPKKSLFCACLQDVIISSHMVNVPVQEITAMEGGWQLRRPAERTLLITAAFPHCASLRGCQQDVGRTHVDKGMAFSFRSRSPLFAQRRGAEFLEGMSGIADIPKGRGPYPGRTASDPGSANSTSTTDYVSPAQPHSLSLSLIHI